MESNKSNITEKQECLLNQYLEHVYQLIKDRPGGVGSDETKQLLVNYFKNFENVVYDRGPVKRFLMNKPKKNQTRDEATTLNLTELKKGEAKYKIKWVKILY